MKHSFSSLLPVLLTSSLLLIEPAAAWGASAKAKNAILLSNVESLTLRGNGAKTTHRRVSAIPQLKCVSHPDLCRHVNIDVMRCTNQGSSYGAEDVEWSCAATLPDEFQLGGTNVVCEGYSSSDDPYILKGSCGVEYRVVLTSKGEARYPTLAGTVRNQNKGSSNTLFWAVFFIIAICIALSALVRYSENNTPRQQRRPRTRGGGGSGSGGGGGGGGGGGPGGWDPRWGSDNSDPPPPYSGPKLSTSSSSNSWRPGFWSGLAAGGAAGYAASRRGGGGYNHSPTYSDYTADNSWRSLYGESSSSQSRPRRTSGASGDTHESTGFGSTSRR